MQAFLSRAAVKLSQNRRIFSTDSGSMTSSGTRAPRSPLVRASLRGRPWVRRAQAHLAHRQFQRPFPGIVQLPKRPDLYRRQVGVIKTAGLRRRTRSKASPANGLGSGVRIASGPTKSRPLICAHNGQS